MLQAKYTYESIQTNKVGRFEILSHDIFFWCTISMTPQDGPSRLKINLTCLVWLNVINQTWKHLLYHIVLIVGSKKSNFTVLGMIQMAQESKFIKLQLQCPESNNQQILIPRCGVPLKPTRCRLSTPMILLVLYNTTQWIQYTIDAHLYNLNIVFYFPNH